MPHEQIQYFSLASVETESNLRGAMDDERLCGLAATLKSVGQLAPIRVRSDGDRWIVVDGHRRLEAARIAGFHEIAAIVEEKSLCAAEVIERQLISACQQEDLKPLEKARAIKALRESTDWSNGQMAARLGLSVATVSRLLALLNLPEGIQAQVECGDIPASAGYRLARIDDADEQTALAAQVANGQLTRDALNEAAKSGRRARAKRRRKSRPPHVTAALGEGRSVTVSGPDLCLPKLVAWLDELLAEARQALTRDVDLETFVLSLRQRPAA